MPDNPTEGSQTFVSGQQEQQMRLLLVRMWVTFLRQGIKAACTAADMLVPWLLPNQGGLVAGLADNLLVSGRRC